MNRLTVGLIAALGIGSAWAATTINTAYAPSGTHLQSGSPDCQVKDYVVECASYDLAGVGKTNATATLSTRYTATVLCTNPGGNVAPGQTDYATLTTPKQEISPKNGRMSVPGLSSATDRATIEKALEFTTTCPSLKWTKSVQPGSLVLVSYIYQLTFAGYGGSYITITG